MFNLEQFIAEWRAQMRAAGIKTPETLDELENHLREEIGRLVRAGTDEAHAFELAAHELGPAVALKREFMKAGNTKWKWLQKVKSFLLATAKKPVPAPDDFEPVARQALEFAPEEARRFRHDFIGTEHLLLGLTRSESQTVSKVMQKFGISSETVRREIELFVSTGAMSVTAATIPFTPRARKALRLAAGEAHRLRQPHVRVEHIFLGLLREGGGVAALVLKNLNVRLENARAEILKEMDLHPGTG